MWYFIGSLCCGGPTHDGSREIYVTGSYLISSSVCEHDFVCFIARKLLLHNLCTVSLGVDYQCFN